MIATRFSALAVRAKLAAVTDLLDGGALEIYGGSPPATVEALPPHEPLAILQFGTPAFHPPSDGVSDAYPLTDEEAAPNAGTATWFRCVTADGHPVVEGSVGTAHADLILSHATILVGTRVSINDFQLSDTEEG